MGNRETLLNDRTQLPGAAIIGTGFRLDNSCANLPVVNNT